MKQSNRIEKLEKEIDMGQHEKAIRTLFEFYKQAYPGHRVEMEKRLPIRGFKKKPDLWVQRNGTYLVVEVEKSDGTKAVEYQDVPEITEYHWYSQENLRCVIIPLKQSSPCEIETGLQYSFLQQKVVRLQKEVLSFEKRSQFLKNQIKELEIQFAQINWNLETLKKGEIEATGRVNALKFTCNTLIDKWEEVSGQIYKTKIKEAETDNCIHQAYKTTTVIR